MLCVSSFKKCDAALCQTSKIPCWQSITFYFSGNTSGMKPEKELFSSPYAQKDDAAKYFSLDP